MNAEKFLDQLVKDGGRIVSSGECSAVEIAFAQACGRFYAREDGMGFVWRPQPKPHYLRQDDDAHWYLVPGDETEMFDNLLCEISGGDEVACDRFNEMFYEYRLGGSPELVPIITAATSEGTDGR